MHLDTESCDVLLLELARQMALDEGGLESDMVSQCSAHTITTAMVIGKRGAALPTSAGLPKGRTYLASTAVTDKDELERGHIGRSSSFGHCCGLLWRGDG